jgi:nitrous oxidase accessory protein NosD
MKKLFLFSGISIVLFFFGIYAYSQNTITVPGDYATIQDAVLAANDGDIIFVSSGTYNGQVTVNKKITIKGKSAETTFLKVAHNESGFVIIADEVSISGFTVFGATDFQESGILIGGEFPGDVRYVSIGDVTISKCILEYNCTGIYIWKAHDCMIVNNLVRYNDAVPHNLNGGNGIIAWEGPSINNSFVNNEIYYNYKYGLFVGGGAYASYDGTKIHGNTFHRNGAYWELWGIDDWNWLALGFMNAEGKIKVSGNKIYPTASSLDVWIWNSPNLVVVGNPVYKANNPQTPVPPDK